MIKNILFDLDDTILDFHAAERRALTVTLDELGISFDEEMLARYSQINLLQWKRLERGEITRKEVKEGRYAQLFAEYGIDVSPVYATSVYEKHLAEGHFFIEGAEKVLQKLFPIYDLYLVSNGTLSVQRGRIASAGIRPYFKGIFVSEEIGADKPDAAFFNACFGKIEGFDKEKTVIVGDSLSSDILGGKNAGITTVWFNPRGEKADTVIPDYQIYALCELPQLLLKL